MKLFHAPTSPFVRKVLMAAHEFGLAKRIEIVPAAVSPVTTNDEVFGANPLGKIPALMLDDGTTLYDSRTIVDYLAAQAGRGMAADDWTGRTLVALGDGLMDAAVALRYETFLRPEDLRWDAWIAGQRGKIDRALDGLEAAVVTPGESLTLPQIGIACALGYLDMRFADAPWRPGRPKLSAFMDAVAERPSFKLTAA